ncbi:DUF3866 family protein [Calidifontibacter terrae]
MITWRAGVVTRVTSSRREVVEVAVRLAEVEGEVRSLAYVELVGRPKIGDRVLLNTNAIDRQLGTGGSALIIAIPNRLPTPPPSTAGHIVKARYTPLQTMVLGVDEQESPHHDTLVDADSIDGMPVVTADLHSALPAILCGIRNLRPQLKVAYVMTDGGALPAAFSRTSSALREADWLTGVVTVGQTFGGDLEAVNVHTGLLAARLVLGADIAVVAQGPGNLGTGTRWGFSGTSAGEALNAAYALGGRPIASLRISEGDARERHYGISHHSSTAYGRVALVPADLPVPGFDGEFGALIDRQAEVLVALSAGRLRRVEMAVDGLRDALAQSPVELRTMGRGLEADGAAFVAAAAAGRHAARIASGA